jgi:putative ABC transport system permease protein
VSPALVLGGLFVLVYGAVATVAVRRPLLARLALREAVRRRGQSVLVVAGLMIGAAGITAALVGADSSGDSAVANAYRLWGRVDLQVTSGDRIFPEEIAGELARDPELGPLLDGVQGGLELVGSAADIDRRQGEPAVRIIGFDPAAQGAFGHYVLTDGSVTLGEDLGPEEVLVSRQLADAVKARPGDRLTISVERGPTQAEPIPFEIAGIARALGPGAYGLRAAVFAPLATVQGLAGVEGINVVRLSASGGGREGLAAAEEALPEVRRAVADLPLGVLFRVKEVKAREVDQAETSTEFPRAMLVGMSALIVAAGAALVVNLTMMLAEERRPRLAVLRALGLTRRGLVTLSVLEGALYSLLAAAVGTGLGLLAGRVVAERFAEAFARFQGGDVDLVFVYSVRAETLAVGFAAGALITLGTVWLAARRTSRLSIPSAIRNLPEPAPEPRRRRWPRVVALSLLMAGGIAGLLSGDDAGRLAGGIAVIVGTSVLVRPRLPERWHASLTGLALAAWSFVIVAALPPGIEPNQFFSVFTSAVLAAVFGLSIFVAANLRVVEGAAGLLGILARRIRALLRPPLAYLARRPLRTGLSTGMFAVILAIVTMLAAFLSIFAPRYERDSAGYEVRVTSTGTPEIELPGTVAPDVIGEAHITTLGYVGEFQSDFGGSENAFVPLFPLDDHVLEDPPIHLSTLASRYEAAEDVWAAIRDDPTLVVSNFGNPDTEIVLGRGSDRVAYTIVANQQFGILDGVVGSQEALEPFGGAPRGVTVLVDVAEAADAEGVASRIERGLFSQGVDAVTTRERLDEGYEANRLFFSVVDVLMRLGLLVGILSLGILGLRAVVERRHAIGVMRALGYRRRGVMAGLMTEAVLTASIGVVVGVAAGTVMGYLFLLQFAEGNPFGLDGPSMFTALGLVYGSVVLVTLWPAWRASRLPPAEAVRYSE